MADKLKPCPLQSECEYHELDCDYYGTNARHGYEMPDEERALREGTHELFNKPKEGERQ